jgi:hypothetical protein
MLEKWIQTKQWEKQNIEDLKGSHMINPKEIMIEIIKHAKENMRTKTSKEMKIQ